MRVQLVASDPATLHSALPWLDITLNEAASAHVTTPATGGSFALALVDGTPAGFVGYAAHGGLLTVHALAVEPARRNLGYGAEVIYTLEESSAARCALALVPEGNGLAIYFWLRLGYRPLFVSEHGRRGYTAMSRTLL